MAKQANFKKCVWCIAHAGHSIAEPYATIGGILKEQPHWNSMVVEHGCSDICPCT